MNKKQKEIIVKHGMVTKIASVFRVTEKTVYNALRGLTNSKKSVAIRQYAIKKNEEV